MINSLYYLGDQIDPIMSKIAEKCDKVLLQGNSLKTDENGQKSTRLKSMPDYRGEYATVDGMKELLTRHGYRVRVDAPEGYIKPVVVGMIL
jgi:hypothetical protein